MRSQEEEGQLEEDEDDKQRGAEKSRKEQSIVKWLDCSDEEQEEQEVAAEERGERCEVWKERVSGRVEMWNEGIEERGQQVGPRRARNEMGYP